MSQGMIWMHPMPFATAILALCLLWPLFVLGFLRTKTRSSAPLAAMILPFALAACGTWVGLINVVRGAEMVGSYTGAAMAAGVAEALMMLVFGAFAASAVALVALIRRHRPVADRGVLVLTALVVTNAVAAIVFAPAMPIAIVGAITALAIAVAAVVWLFAVARTIVTPHPLPRSAVVVFVSIVLVAIVAWQRVEAFVHIAQYGQ